MEALHKSSRLTNNHKLLFILLAIALSIVAICPVFIKYAIGEAAAQKVVNSITLGGNNESNEYAADPYYATKAY